MKFLGFDITRAKQDKPDRRSFVPNFFSDFDSMQPDDYASLMRAYRSWVYVCANKNSNSVAQSQLRLYVSRRDTAAKSLYPTRAVSANQIKYLNTLSSVTKLSSFRSAVVVEELTEHPFIDLMSNVNQFINGFDLWDLTTLHQELTGNAYWFISRDSLLNVPGEIWVMPPDKVTIVPDKETFIKGYVYQNGTEKIFFEPEDVIHFKYSNPNDMFYGKSPLSAVIAAYNINENMTVYESALFRNMARPEGVLHTEQKLSDTEFDRLKEQWRSIYGGTGKSGKTAVLEKGVGYTPISINPRDLSFIEGRSIVKEEIMNAYGQTLAMYDKSANRSNSEQANVAYKRDAIQPRLRRMEDKLNERLLPMFDFNLFVAFDSPVPEDRDFRLKERELNLKVGYSSINQEREIDGQGPVDWGEVPYLPMNVAPVDDLTSTQLDEFARSVADVVKGRLNG